MDGDIGVAEQLGAEAEQCLLLLARRMHLYELKLSALSTREEAARREEEELTRNMNLLKEMEAAYNRETAAAREALAEKSCQFQELTRRAAESLSVRALEMETSRLDALTRDLQARERELNPDGRPPVDEASVQGLLAQVEDLHRRFQKVSADHETVRALSREAVRDASDLGAVRRQQDVVGDEYRQMLEEAVEDMTLLLVDAEMSASSKAEDAAAQECSPLECQEEYSQSSLTRLALLRDECDSHFSELQDALRVRAESNRALALELGLLEQLGERAEDPELGLGAPDSVTSGSRNLEDAVGSGGSAPESSDHEEVSPATEPLEARATTAADAEVVLSLEQKQNESASRVAEIVLG